RSPTRCRRRPARPRCRAPGTRRPPPPPSWPSTPSSSTGPAAPRKAPATRSTPPCQGRHADPPVSSVLQVHHRGGKILLGDLADRGEREAGDDRQPLGQLVPG